MSKVLIVGERPLPIENENFLSGPGIRTWQMAKPLIDDGHQVCLVCLNTVNSAVKEPKANGLSVFSLNQQQFTTPAALQEIHDRFRPDCIVSISSFLQSKAVIGLNTAKPVWFDRGDLLAEAQLKSFTENNDDYLYLFLDLERNILARGDIFSCYSLPQKFALMGKLGDAGRLNKETVGYEFAHVMPCAIEKGEHKLVKNIIRGRLVQNDDFVILWSGGYNTWADTDTLFAALEIAMNKNKKIKFVSTGGVIPGQDETTYKKFSERINSSPHKNRYILLGWLALDDLPNIYLESNLAINIDKNCYEVVLGSRHRLLDWMKAGLPILTTAPSELTQALSRNQMAFSFTQEDPSALAQMILELAAQPKLLQQYAARAKHFVIEEYSFEKTTQALRAWVASPQLAPDSLSAKRKGQLFLVPEARHIEKLKEEITILQAQRDNAQNHARNLESQITASLEEYTSLNTHIRNLETEREQVKLHIGNLETERKQIKLHIGNLESERENVKEHVNNLEKQVAAFSEERKSLHGHIHNLEAEREQVKFHINNLNNQLNAFIGERDNLQAKVADLEGSLGRARESFLSMENEYTAISKRLNKITSTRIYRIFLLMRNLAERRFVKRVAQQRTNIQVNEAECKFLPVILFSKPILIYAEISTKCNLQCRMCGRSYYKLAASDEGFMTRKVFKRLSRLFSPDTKLALFGRGETLLHPDFIRFLKIAAKKKARVTFNTNGLLLNARIAEAMVKYNQAEITFSCSAGTRQTYQKIHGTDGWEKLWGNIARLNEMKAKYNPIKNSDDLQLAPPVIFIEFVAHASNLAELPILLEKAYAHHVRGITITNLVAHTPEMEKERTNLPQTVELANQYYAQTEKLRDQLYKEKGMVFSLMFPESLSAVAKKFILDEPDRKKSEALSACEKDFCLEPWKTFFVRFNGTVAPCCITGRVLGDLNSQDAEQVWNGEMFEKFRSKMKQEDKPYECQRCHLFPGAKKYDKALDDPKLYDPL
ncbi:MAG: radical SAM protein [Candidatus Omnitrophica bacterium]|nr:radical SAM protein [Candidatus Omnitrophota bacterium]